MLGRIGHKTIFIFLLIGIGVRGHAQTVSDFVTIPIPDDLEVDRWGNIWVNYRISLSTEEHRLARISPDGTITDVITANHTLGQFGVNDSIIWIAGEWGPNAYVFKYNHYGVRLDSLYLPYPTEIILDSDGTWFVTQNALGKLTKVYPNKTTQTLASGYPLNHNLALARDENGMFYTCNLMDAKVIKINPNTGSKTTLATLPFLNPYSVGFLSYTHGKLFVPSFNHCIYKVDTAGSSYALFAGSETYPGDVNGDAATAMMNQPIATHPSLTGDTLYFTDSGNNKVKMITGLNMPITVSEHHQFKDNIEIYPNPASDFLFLEYTANNDCFLRIEILNVNGQILSIQDFSHLPNQNFYKLSLEQLPKGVYVLRITSSSYSIHFQKVIKS